MSRQIGKRHNTGTRLAPSKRTKGGTGKGVRIRKPAPEGSIAPAAESARDWYYPTTDRSSAAFDSRLAEIAVIQQAHAVVENHDTAMRRVGHAIIVILAAVVVNILVTVLT